MAHKKDIKTRRQRNIELTRRDRANRCPVCLKALDGAAVVNYGTDQRFCSYDCMDEAEERREAQR